MKTFNAILAATLLGSTYAQQYTGFNYGNKKPTGELKVRQDYLDEFEAARNLVGTNGQYTSARIYTTVQGDSGSAINEAIFAANQSKTSVLLGLWCSAGRGVFDGEKVALTSVFNTFRPEDLRGLIAGISVGSEDIYRISDLDTGTDPGEQPGVIAGYINEIKQLVANTPGWSGIPVGHVDTWNVYTNATNWPELGQVIDAVDFIGMNGFPYFQSKDVNSPENLGSLFATALRSTQEASRGKPVWVTETGFPTYGPTFNLAVPGAEVAQRYYQDVGCGQLFGKVNTWWYILLDGVNPPPANPQTPAFGVLAPPLRPDPAGPVSTQPIYSLSCPAPPASTGMSSTSVANYSGTTLAFATPSLIIGGGGFPLSSPSTFVTLNSSSQISSSGLSTSTSSSTPSSPSVSSCPADLNGVFEYPHLIVPISSSQPDSALGTQYFGTVNDETSTLYNFDIPPSLEGQTCSVVFLFPRPEQLVWSTYDFNSQGGLSISQLSSPADEGTSFSNTPSGSNVSSIGTVQPGSNYVVSSGPCPAGERIGYRVDPTGGLSLNYFQDYNPAGPIGLFLRAC
ncbi:ubiquitin 3 binding protein But2 C-terminal domain-containing protein 2 [Elsinoe australis]|uniref:Ubiquitin 3 binding protein But2 C-terminal domain-containing protein 2 n=1 Tax=Elsinoe australis TaxID=40998 RepID=A0A4U7B1W1_9PEZI|nr:ubiquitin 3 binding protein But2 C-terminal domain-containing protein 2 [Elsinoe australis]